MFHFFKMRDSGFIRHWSFVLRISAPAGHVTVTRPIANQRCLPLAVLLFLACGGCAHLSSTTVATAESEIRAVLDAQVRDWNAGDLRGFMEGYARSERTRFQSGGDV